MEKASGSSLKANQPEFSKSSPLQTFELLVRSRASKTFYWDTNVNEATIQGLKNHIAANYDEKKVAVVTANIMISVSNQSRTVADDNNLRNTLKFFAKEGIKTLTIDLKPREKAYSAWSIDEVLRDVLDSEVQNYLNLPSLNIERLLLDHATPTFNGPRRNEFINNLKKIHRAFNCMIEASSRNFINPFLIEAIGILDELEPIQKLQKELKRNLLVLAVEFVLNGSLGIGKVDYAFLFSTFTIIITEAKIESISQGIAQNIVQLHSASESLKRKHDQTPALSAVYGIVSTGDRWLFTRWVISSGKPVLQISQPYYCTFSDDNMEELKVLKIITTILAIQALKLCELYENNEIEIDQVRRGEKV